MSSVYDPYTTTSSGRTEIDLREELEGILYGSAYNGEIPKGRVGLLRKARRDSDNNPIKCPCRDTITDESDKDTYCRTCLGFGYLWDEHKIVYYKDEDSLSKRGEIYFYFESFETPTDIDMVIQVVLDEEGNVVTPATREYYFKILRAESFRSDNARIEYWRCRTKLEKVWSVWYGNQNRNHEPTERI